MDNSSADQGAPFKSGRPPRSYLTFGLKNSWERAEFKLALVTGAVPVSTLAGTGSPFDAASVAREPQH
jgi:hypothetical protein